MTGRVEQTGNTRFKRPESVLVVICRPGGQALLLKRVDHPDFWQSVTGSMRWDETDPRQTAVRELQEETGLAATGLVNLQLHHHYSILPEWRYRYAPDVTGNTEHAFALQVSVDAGITLNPREHSEYCWLPMADAAQRVWSWSNRDVLLQLVGHDWQ